MYVTIANYITAARLGFMPVFLACVLGYSPERAYLRQAAEVSEGKTVEAEPVAVGSEEVG